jgi:hypothetical protein
VTEGAPDRLPKEEAVALVKRATLAVFEHFAGPARSVPPPEQKWPAGRYAFNCPGCGGADLKVVVFEDGEPPGYGRGGCPAPRCPVPKNGDVLDFVRAVLARGKSEKPSFDAALEAALAAARSRPPVGAAPPEGPPAPREPSGPFLSGSLPLLEDPEDPSRPSEALFGPLPGEARPADGPAPRGDRPRALTRRRPAEPGGAQPDLLSSLPAAAGAPERRGNLAARARVYEELLRLCPPDGRLVEDLATLGISEGLPRREGFGAFYPAAAAEVLAQLQLKFGAATLLCAPGFDAPSHAGPPRFELERGGEDALYALVPYRDARGRVVALEALDLRRGATFGEHRLLGSGKDGRDDPLGGAHHLWCPGDPSLLQAITDDLLEGLRAASAGVRCAAIRGPTSYYPGREAVPELEGVSFAGRRILYAPSPSARAREAAPRAARGLIWRHGGTPLILRKPRERGLGSYLLGHAPEERRRAFALLCSPANAAVLDAGEATGPRLGGPAAEAPEPPPAPAAPRAGRHRDPFAAEARKKPRRPSTRRGFSARETIQGLCAAPLAFLAVWLPLTAAEDLLRSLAAGAAHAVGSGLGASGDSARSLLREPHELPLLLLGRVLGPRAEPVADLLGGLAAAGLGSAPELFAGAAGLLAGLAVAAAFARHRRKRMQMTEGRLKQW